jgi:hypothetical protein
MPVQHDLYMQHHTANTKVADPGSGGAVKLCNITGGVLTITSTGARKLPDSPVGTRLTVIASGADVTLQNSAGTHVVTIGSGRCADLIANSSTGWQVSNYSTAGFLPLPLDGWREVTSNDITNAAGNGGVLATDTTPTLEYVNGDTDSQIRVLWATSNSDPIARQIPLPSDLDRTQDIQIIFYAIASGDTDTITFDADSFFDTGDTKVEDASNEAETTATVCVITIAAADVPDDAYTLSVELTPVAHTNDTVAIYSSYLSYTKKVV